MERREFIKNCFATGTGCLVLAGVTLSSVSISGQKDDNSALNRGKLPMRPPGALDEEDFLKRCIRCMRCVDACPNHAILALDDKYGKARKGTPYIKPRRQACMLCNRMEGDHLKCTGICPTGALQPVKKTVEDITAKVDMGKAEIDKVLCYSYNNWSCGACFRACPLAGKAMTLGLWEKPEVNTENCIGCGACERACIRYPQAVRVKPRNSK